jgi:hypothetical protein
MQGDDLIELELMLNRFRKLIGELLRGVLLRNSFQPWEIDILLDMQECDVPPRRKLEILRQYQRAVEKQMLTGPGPPMKLSAFLQERTTRRPIIENSPESTMRIASE